MRAGAEPDGPLRALPFAQDAGLHSFETPAKNRFLTLDDARPQRIPVDMARRHSNNLPVKAAGHRAAGTGHRAAAPGGSDQ
ncbi:hypothetical protein Slala05_81600 [Streptomyces lavendulae subsp. lavendulae]|nr:hypothetical protein Slala05_81600 [Streptomyces lavendulae subsp. lavendulae]